MTTLQLLKLELVPVYVSTTDGVIREQPGPRMQIQAADMEHLAVELEKVRVRMERSLNAKDPAP